MSSGQAEIEKHDNSYKRVLERGQIVYGKTSMSEEYSISELLDNDNIGVFTKVDNLPHPKNGFDGFYKHLSKNLKYPVLARKNEGEGKVFVAFVVTKSGVIEGVTIAKGIGSGCDEAARQVIMNSPDWIPGSLESGENVNVRMILPITFALRKKKNKKSD